MYLHQRSWFLPSCRFPCVCHLVIRNQSGQFTRTISCMKNHFFFFFLRKKHIMSRSCPSTHPHVCSLQLSSRPEPDLVDGSPSSADRLFLIPFHTPHRLVTVLKFYRFYRSISHEFHSGFFLCVCLPDYFILAKFCTLSFELAVVQDPPSVSAVAQSHCVFSKVIWIKFLEMILSIIMKSAFQIFLMKFFPSFPIFLNYASFWSVWSACRVLFEEREY